MGCCGEREKGPPEYTAKWDYLTLSDFKATSTWASLGYVWLWLMALVAVAVYVLDTYTAINLIAFDHWSSQIQPVVPFKYSKWIFAACIILSWGLLFYEWFRAVRVMKRGGVAESYMDPLAVSLLCMKGQGWRRFLVFTSLTKSKKGADYIALFVYFAFNGAIRVVLAEGPRQAINGMTLYTVLRADLVKNLNNSSRPAILQFFVNIQTLADSNVKQALIICSMLFTFVVWLFSALSLLSAIIFYIVFLWHYIPQSDGRLSVYCKRKIDRRLEKIVEHKVKAAIEDEHRKKEKEERKAEKAAEYTRKKTGELPVLPPKLTRAPTLPQLGESPNIPQDEKVPEIPLSRQTSNTSNSTLSSQQRRDRQPTLPGVDMERPGLSRTATQASAFTNASYESDAPLLANAGYAGEGGAPPLPRPVYNRNGPSAPYGPGNLGRTMTQSTQGTDRSFTPMGQPGMQRPMGPPGMQRPFTPVGQPGMPRPFTPVGEGGMQRPFTPSGQPGMPRPFTPGGEAGIQRPFTPSGQPGMQRSFTPVGEAGMQRSFTPAGQPGMQRPFTPVGEAGMQRPSPPMSNNGSVSSRAPPGPRGPPPRSNTGFSFDTEPQSAISVTSPVDAYGRPTGPPSRQNTPGPNQSGIRGHGSQSSSFSRPLPPLARQPTQGSVSSNTSFSRPMQTAHDAPHAAALYRPFTPASAVEPSSAASYEMTSQPAYASSTAPESSVNGSYVAFNPSASKSSPTPESQTPLPSATNHLMLPDSSANNRLTTGYADILDDYGASGRSSAMGDHSSGRTSPNLVSSYHGEPNVTAQHQQQGWHHP